MSIEGSLKSSRQKKLSYGILITLAVLLTLQIWLPALNRTLWQDEIDFLLFGRSGGQISEEHPYPIVPVALDEDGKNILYQPGWIFLNQLVDASGIPHGFWRLINIMAFVGALALFAFRRLPGYWSALPLLMALFSDYVFRSASMVRHYNFACFFFVAALLLMNSKYKKTFYLSLIILWQINILAFLGFAFAHGICLIVECLKKPELRKSIAVFFAFYIFTALCQYQISYEMIHSDPHLPIVAARWVRFQVSFLTYNNAVIPIILLLPLLIMKKDKEVAFFRALVIFTILIMPFVFKGFRSIYLVFFLPYLIVEYAVFLRGIKKPWVLVLLVLAVFTNVLSWPFNQVIDYENPKYFYDKLHVSDKILKTTPHDALFEARHKKWTEIRAIVTYIAEKKNEKDFVLYDLSRDSIMANLAYFYGMKTTGLFPKHHPYYAKHPDSSLVKPRLPFWAVSPYSFSDNLTHWQRKGERVKFLSQYGKVVVHRIPKRNKGWVKVADYPPPELDEPGDYVVYYVE